jgi:hypothetical protein
VKANPIFQNLRRVLPALPPGIAFAHTRVAALRINAMLPRGTPTSSHP